MIALVLYYSLLPEMVMLLEMAATIMTPFEGRRRSRGEGSRK